VPAAGGDQPVATGGTGGSVAAPTGAPPAPGATAGWRPSPPSPAPPGPAPADVPSPPALGPAELQLSVRDVYLLVDGPQGLRATPGHDLRVGGDGLTLASTGGATVWSVPWSEVDQLAVPERSPLPDGREGVVVEVATAQGTKRRCLVPAGHWWALGGAFEALARSRGVAPGRERRLPWLLTALLVLMAAGAVAALLLASGHLIRL
jgi:hypothetical protein